MKRKRSTRENGLKTSAFRSEAPNRATPITAAPASKRAYSTELVEEAQRLEEVFVRTNPAPALSEDEIAFHEFLKYDEYLGATYPAEESTGRNPPPEVLQAHSREDPTMEWLPPAIAPEISELLRRAHQILTRNGFDVGAHPWNRHGDGRTWSVIFEPTEETPKGADPVELARRVLEEKGVEVKSAHKLRNGSFGVVILPPARASRSAAASLGPQQDPASELFQKSEGIEPAVFTPSTNEWPKAHNLDTLAEKLGETFKQARESFAQSNPAPKIEDRKSAHWLGEWANTRLPEFKNLVRRIRSGSSAEKLREQFSLLFTEVIDRLPRISRDRLFGDAQSRLLPVPELMGVLADVKGLTGATLTDYRKQYRRAQRQSSTA